MKENIDKRFWTKVDKSAGHLECWPWIAGASNSGYGTFWDGDKYTSAHRVAFLIDGGAVTEEAPDVLHKCHELGFQDNRLCCNPLHLKAGSKSENVRDSVRNFTQRNARKTHCYKGHNLSGDNVRIQNSKNGGKSRRCLTCERAFLSDPKQVAYRKAWYSRLREKKRAIKALMPPKLKPPKVKTLPSWPEKVGEWLQVGRLKNPLAVPIFYPDGTVFVPLSKQAWRGMYTKVDFDKYEIVNALNWTAWWGHTTKSFYATSHGKNGETIYLHRLLLGLNDKSIDADHKNHDTLDNRDVNIRRIPRRGNCQNRKDNTSGHPGVYWDKSRGLWVASITINAKDKYLGRFAAKEDAVSAYRKACESIGSQVYA